MFLKDHQLGVEYIYLQFRIEILGYDVTAYVEMKR